MAYWPKKSSKRPWYLIDLDNIIYLLLIFLISNFHVSERGPISFIYGKACIILWIIFTSVLTAPLALVIYTMNISIISMQIQVISQQHKKRAIFGYVTETTRDWCEIDVNNATSSTTILKKPWMPFDLRIPETTTWKILTALHLTTYNLKNELDPKVVRKPLCERSTPQCYILCWQLLFIFGRGRQWRDENTSSWYSPYSCEIHSGMWIKHCGTQSEYCWKEPIHSQDIGTKDAGVANYSIALTQQHGGWVNHSKLDSGGVRRERGTIHR